MLGEGQRTLAETILYLIGNEKKIKHKNVVNKNHSILHDKKKKKGRLEKGSIKFEHI